MAIQEAGASVHLCDASGRLVQELCIPVQWRLPDGRLVANCDSNGDPYLNTPSVCTVEYVEGDLFDVARQRCASLAHCVACDLRMGAGIAVQFRVRYGAADKPLLHQCANVGACGVRTVAGNLRVYYLVTKRHSLGKPTLATLEAALCSLRRATAGAARVIAMPRIGCGLDRLAWPDVARLINKVFEHRNVHIIVVTRPEDAHRFA